MDDKEFFYDFAKFEVQAIAQRNNFLMVFQSMLFAATALIAGRDIFFPVWVPMAVGFTLSVIWVYLNWLTYVIETAAMKKLEEADERVRLLFKARKANFLLSKGSVSIIVTFVIPSIMIICWAILIWYYAIMVVGK